MRKQSPAVLDRCSALADKAAGESDRSMTNSAPIDQEPTFIEVGEGNGGRRIAVRARAGGAPGLFWLGGFNSDMRGTKALALDAWAAEHGRACVRFDYSGHGESGGAFIDGTIGRWLEESVAVFEQFCRGPQVVIGSSMGGWMALLLARAIASRDAKAGDAGRAGADRAGARFHRAVDVERLSPTRSARRSGPRASGCGRRSMATARPIRSRAR